MMWTGSGLVGLRAASIVERSALALASVFGGVIEILCCLPHVMQTAL